MSASADEEKIIEDVLESIEEWEADMTPFFGMWNEWANHYRMKRTTKERRPDGVSRNISAETPRAVNSLATAITSRQTYSDPYFELKSDEASEDELYFYQKKYINQLNNMEFERKLWKGNRGMCLFGTQVWETPVISFPIGSPKPFFTGTDFNPLSLLQVPFRSKCYDMKWSDFIGAIHKFSPSYLRFLASSPIWDQAAMEDGLREKTTSGTGGTSKSAIDTRRQSAGYTAETKEPLNELILWHGRFNDLKTYDNPLIAEMWERYAQQGEPKDSDITIGILNRRRIVRLNPTPYGTWHHLYQIGHYIEFELEAIAYGVGAFGSELQKDQNRILRRINDVELFDLYSMKLVGNGAGLNNSALNVFPFALFKCNDVNQVKDLKPNIEGIPYGLKLMDFTRQDFRAVTLATDSLQGVGSGNSATEEALVHGQSMQAIDLSARINANGVIRPYLQTMHLNEIDQNPYDPIQVRDLDIKVKVATDKDNGSVMFDKKIKLLELMTSVRSVMPIDFNAMPLLKNLVALAGLNPADLREPRPQMDKMLDAARRINGDSEMKNALMGEMAGAGQPGSVGVPRYPGAVPTSPVQ